METPVLEKSHGLIDSRLALAIIRLPVADALMVSATLFFGILVGDPK